MKLVFCSLLLLTYVISECWTLKEADCEGTLKYIYLIVLLAQRLLFFFFYLVCFAVVRKFDESLTVEDKKDTKVIEDKFRKYCKNAKGKEARFVS